MAASSQQSLRKAIGALKDSTKVGLVNLNSDNKAVDIAIVKATNHDETLPKEKHIQTILDAVSASQPHSDVAYCIQGLARRLAKTHSWTVALKTLLVIHRALREVDSFFHELINYNKGRGLMMNLSHFRDESSPVAWDYSAWIRTYALYLEERVECFRVLNYDIEKSGLETKRMRIADLLDQLPYLQQLLFRLLGCKPEGAAIHNGLIQFALSIVVSESVKLYVAITDGILNVIDQYFEMQRHVAIRALEIYRKAGIQADSLNELFEICRGLSFGQGQKYITIEKPPASFLSAMEDYVKQSPTSLALQSTAARNVPAIKGPEPVASEADLLADNQDSCFKEESPEPTNRDNEVSKQEADVKDQRVTTPEPTRGNQSEPAASQQIGDLLGLDEPIQEASQLDDKNSLPLAIVTSENPSNSGNELNTECKTLDWELALVTVPSSNGAVAAESKMGGGLDKLTLDSLYEEGIARRANPAGANNLGQMACNPFENAYCNQDPFYASMNVAPPTNVQLADLTQQQNFMEQHQQQLPMSGQNETNPHGNPFVEQSLPCHPPQNTYSGSME